MSFITPFFELNNTPDKYLMLFNDFEKSGAKAKEISERVGGYFWLQIEKGGKSASAKQEFFKDNKKKFQRMVLATYGRTEALVIDENGIIKKVG
jgi:hypothetical protein